MKQASVSSTDQGGGKRRLGLGTASFLLAISMFQHAIPTHIRPQVRDLALCGLVAMMIAVELTTLLWWRRADDDHQNEGCGIDHGDLFTRSAKRLTKEEARRMVVNFANVAGAGLLHAWDKLMYINAKRPEPCHKATMGAFLYHCPTTGFQVQGWVMMISLRRLVPLKAEANEN
jgi:hypothetical protein